MEITRDDRMGAGKYSHIKTSNKLHIELAQEEGNFIELEVMY